MNDHQKDGAGELPGDAGWMVPALLGPYGHQPAAEPESVARPELAAEPTESTEPPAQDQP